MAGFVKQYLRLDEVALMLNVHIGTVRRWTNEGALPAIRTAGNHRRIPWSAMARFGASANLA